MHNASTSLYFSFIFMFQFLHVSAISYDGAGNRAGFEAACKLKEAAEIVAPQLATASSEFGKEFGVGAVTVITTVMSDGGASVTAAAAKLAAFLKAAGATIIAAPATPYIVAGVICVGSAYGAYKAYCYFNPSTGEKILMTEEKAQLYVSKAQLAKAKTEYYKAKAQAAEEKKVMICVLAAAAAA